MTDKNTADIGFEQKIWDVFSGHSHSPDVGSVIDRAMLAIDTENISLKDVLPKMFCRPELDKKRLSEVVDLFTNISKFAESEGDLAGEFYPPFRNPTSHETAESWSISKEDCLDILTMYSYMLCKLDDVNNGTIKKVE